MAQPGPCRRRRARTHTHPQLPRGRCAPYGDGTSLAPTGRSARRKGLTESTVEELQQQEEELVKAIESRTHRDGIQAALRISVGKYCPLASADCRDKRTDGFIK